jgi:hypothetical protein
MIAPDKSASQGCYTSSIGLSSIGLSTSKSISVLALQHQIQVEGAMSRASSRQHTSGRQQQQQQQYDQHTISSPGSQVPKQPAALTWPDPLVGPGDHGDSCNQ